MWHKHLYFMWSFFVLYSCPMIYMFLLICKHNFWIFRVPVNSLLLVTCFCDICNSVILRPPYKACIWILAVTLSTFIFGVRWNEIWTEFIIALSFSLLLKILFSWVWSSTVNVLWVSKIFSFYSSYWMIQIQVINFKADKDSFLIQNYYLPS